MLELIKARWVSPSPAFFKRIIKYSIAASVGAVAVLGAEKIGQAALPGFTYTLLPWASMVLKNIFVAGMASAAVSKLTCTDPNNLPDAKR